MGAPVSTGLGAAPGGLSGKESGLPGRPQTGRAAEQAVPEEPFTVAIPLQRAGMCCGPCPPDRPARPASRQGPASAATLVSSSLTGSPSPSEHVDAPQTTSVPNQGPVGWPVGASFLPGKHVHVMAQVQGRLRAETGPSAPPAPRPIFVALRPPL